jgi:hypothetical protein
VKQQQQQERRLPSCTKKGRQGPQFNLNLSAVLKELCRLKLQILTNWTLHNKCLQEN